MKRMESTVTKMKQHNHKCPFRFLFFLFLTEIINSNIYTSNNVWCHSLALNNHQQRRHQRERQLENMNHSHPNFSMQSSSAASTSASASTTEYSNNQQQQQTLARPQPQPRPQRRDFFHQVITTASKVAITSIAIGGYIPQSSNSKRNICNNKNNNSYFCNNNNNNQIAWALGEGEQRMVFVNKPKAPLAALIPAAQQRLLLEQCLVTASKLATMEKSLSLSKNKDDDSSDLKNLDNNNEVSILRQQLESVMINPNDTTNNNNNNKTKQQNQNNNSKKNNFIFTNNSNNKDLSIMSKFSPNQVLSGDVARAVMNIYTANLQYGDNAEYTVTDPTWKKSYIRANDGLPDIQRVITADLDLRDLYRNQVQVKLDDAAAELFIIYNTSTNTATASATATATTDWEELAKLLQDAANSFDLWLDRIDVVDVQQALQAAVDAKSTVKVYDSYFAGFIPPK